MTSVTRAIPFVKRIVQMRNAVDHPKPGPGERMAYANFDIADADGQMILVDPSWALTGEVARPMLQDFDQVIETIIAIGEQILINLFEKLRPSPLLMIAEIPAGQRDPAKPARLVVTMVGPPA